MFSWMAFLFLAACVGGIVVYVYARHLYEELEFYKYLQKRREEMLKEDRYKERYNVSRFK